jgi:hypothetical protein
MAKIEFMAKLNKGKLSIYCILSQKEDDVILISTRNRCKKISPKILHNEMKQFFDKNKIKTYIDGCIYALTCLINKYMQQTINERKGKVKKRFWNAEYIR